MKRQTPIPAKTQRAAAVVVTITVRPAFVREIGAVAGRDAERLKAEDRQQGTEGPGPKDPGLSPGLIGKGHDVFVGFFFMIQ